MNIKSWFNQKGKNQPPFTIVTMDDIEAGIWSPSNKAHEEKESILFRAKNYINKLQLSVKSDF
jgi:hypothetical protein